MNTPSPTPAGRKGLSSVRPDTRQALLAQASEQRDRAIALVPAARFRVHRLRKVVDWVEMFAQAPMLAGVAIFVGGWLLRRLLRLTRAVAGPMTIVGLAVRAFRGLSRGHARGPVGQRPPAAAA